MYRTGTLVHSLRLNRTVMFVRMLDAFTAVVNDGQRDRMVDVDGLVRL